MQTVLGLPVAGWCLLICAAGVLSSDNDVNKPPSVKSRPKVALPPPPQGKGVWGNSELAFILHQMQPNSGSYAQLQRQAEAAEDTPAAEEHMSCKLDYATGCLYELVKKVGEAEANPFGKCPEAWIAVELADVCFALHSVGCPPPFDYAYFQDWLKWSRDTVTATCDPGTRPTSTAAPPPTTTRSTSTTTRAPGLSTVSTRATSPTTTTVRTTTPFQGGACDPYRAGECLYELVKRVVDAGVEPWKKCLEAWLALQVAEPCFALTAWACPPPLNNFFDEWFRWSQSFVDSACTTGGWTPPPISQIPGGIRCYKCKKAKSHSECNQQTELCKYYKQACQSVIYEKKGGKLEITKGCKEGYSCKDRCSGSRCYHCCYTDLCNGFWDVVTATTPITAPTTTERPSCREQDAIACINLLNQRILETEISGGDFANICQIEVPNARQCVSDALADCSQSTRDRVQAALDFIIRSLEEKCPQCYPAQAEACLDTLRDMIDRGDRWSLVCQYLAIAEECKNRNLRDCSDNERDSIDGLWESILYEIGDNCSPKLQIIQGEKVEVEEGGASGYFEFMATRSPREMCYTSGEDCRAFVDLALDINNKPKCVNGKVIAQAVLQTGRPDMNMCSYEITQNNWNQLQRRQLVAKLDMKFDGPQTRNLTVTLRTESNGMFLERVPIGIVQVKAIDRDRQAICKSINDPHMTTFDGHFYNNFEEGYFTLYKHSELPFEVQALFQRCNKNANCNCAIAIKSGDTVFIVDRCRRRGDSCGGRVSCGGLLTTRSYLWDRVTPGTRIFKRNGGRTFEIIFPHGTTVKIQAQGQFLNAWVTPSPADFGKTKGLCGLYDGVRANDLMLPDGSVYPGPGAGRRQQPRGFNIAWKVPNADRIFSGAPYQPHSTQAHCECRNTGPNSPPEANCGYNALLELCDLDTSAEITNELLPQTIMMSAANGGHTLSSRVARQSEDEDVWFSDDDVDVEEGWTPPEMEWPSGNWTEESAYEFCENYIQQQTSAGRDCGKLPGLGQEDEVDSCVADIKTTGGTEWADSALEAMKEACTTLINRNSTFLEQDEDGIAEDIIDNICLNECSGRGECFVGMCICTEGFTGDDCSQTADAVPESLDLPLKGLCDVRRKDCTTIVVYGDSFIDDESLTCALQKVEVSSNNTLSTGDPYTVPGTFFGYQEMSCRPRETGSYRLAVSNDGANFSDYRLFVHYDSTCYICDTDGLANARCSRKLESHCIIAGACFASGAENPDNSCQYCQPLDADDKWVDSRAAECKGFTGLIVGIVVPVVVLLGVGLTLTVVLHKRRMRRLQEANQMALRRVEEAKKSAYPENSGDASRKSSNVGEDRRSVTITPPTSVNKSKGKSFTNRIPKIKFNKDAKK